MDFGHVNSVGKGPRGLDPHMASHGNDKVRLGLRKWSAALAQGWEHTLLGSLLVSADQESPPSPPSFSHLIATHIMEGQHNQVLLLSLSGAVGSFLNNSLVGWQ